ncbi:TetR/AcrR family transcriptional regulator [Citrobacter youngae]|uniref:TetR/AcrR family transcriptional regulator n=1 Tax=Citrobacter youngae TaxID=133448 RepID=UPI00139EF52B|nr:TetR/AcrR family transcriptional regulator [Citrobacter youngae]
MRQTSSIAGLPLKGRPRGFNSEEALMKALNIFWKLGYEPTSIASLCAAISIRPPSLYAAFGSKAELFIEAANFYERMYWNDVWARLEYEPDIFLSVARFFDEAAEILLSESAPCGCLVVLAAINVSSSSPQVSEAVREIRQAGKRCFATRIRRAVNDGQLPLDTDVDSLATVLNSLLAGMSVEAKDGASQQLLQATAKYAVRLLRNTRQ